MVRVGGARQRFRSAFLEPQLDRTPLGAHVTEPELVSPLTRDDDEVDSVRKEVRPSAKTLAAQPLHTISPYRASDLASHDDPQPGRPRRRRLGCHEQCEMRGAHATAFTLLAGELGVSAQPAVAPKLKRHYFL